MPIADEPLYEMLPWDSDFFGFPTARILPPALDQNGLETSLHSLKSLGAVLAYWLADPLHAESTRAAAACGGYLADFKLTYAADRPSAVALESPWSVAPVREGAFPEDLLALAVRAGSHSRFRTDPRFPPELFRALYEEWMRKSLSGDRADAVLAAVDGEGLAGMITVSADTAGHGAGRERGGSAITGSIGLIAVAERAEGQGLGSALVRAAGNWMADQGCASARVVTQGANLSACRLYEKNGYRVEKREDAWHFWLDGRA